MSRPPDPIQHDRHRSIWWPTTLTGAIGTHTKGQDMQPNTDHTRSKGQYWTKTCIFS
jgi:hypothetical protein